MLTRTGEVVATMGDIVVNRMAGRFRVLQVQMVQLIAFEFMA